MVRSNHRLERLTDWTKDPAAIETAFLALLDRKRFPGRMLKDNNPLRRGDRYKSRDSWLSGNAAGTSGSQSAALALVDFGGPVFDGTFESSRFTNPDPLLYGNQYLQSEIDTELQQIGLQLDVDSVVAALEGVGRPDGRRILMTVGFELPAPDYVAPGRLSNVSWFATEGHTYDRTDMLENMVRTANLLGYTIYPVPVGQNNYSLANKVLDHKQLAQVAKRTGGRVLFSQGKALNDAMADTRSYYWLGFTPEPKRDNRGHSIRLELARPDLKLRHRSGYIDLSPDRERALAANSALLFGNTQEDMNAMQVVVGEPKRTGFRMMSVSATLNLRFDRFAVVPHRGTGIALGQLRIAAIDKTGLRSPLQKLDLRLNATDPGLEDGIHTLPLNLQLRRQPHDLVFSVSDLTSGEIWNQRVRIVP